MTDIPDSTEPATYLGESSVTIIEPQPPLPELSIGDLSPALQKVIRDHGWSDLMLVQKKASPYLLNAMDIIVQSKTGSGKTGAFLIPSIETLDALAESVPDEVRALVAKFWPGGLTVILPARSSLSWDLGDARGTVALRMPSNRVALALLAETGPLAVSSANLTGKPAAHTSAEARADLGESVSVYLSDGEVGVEHAGAPDPGSTIVDATALLEAGGRLRIVRHGVIGDDAIRDVVGADRCE